MNILKSFIGQYPVSKTLRFELIPMLNNGQTIDVFWNSYLGGSENDAMHEIYLRDKERNDNYPIMKVILDQFHKEFISSTLNNFNGGEKGVTWKSLAEAYYEDKKSEHHRKLQDEMRKKIHEAFKHHDWWPYISSYSKLIGFVREKVAGEDGFVQAVIDSYSKTELTREKLLKAISVFNKFIVYFGNYQDNRNNMFSDKEQNTAIPYRIVNENFPKFLDNIAVYKRLQEICPQELNSVEKNLSTYLNGNTLDNVFVLDYYNQCLTQRGIEAYNRILGGNPNEGVLGINNVGNEYLQQNPDSPFKLRSLEMSKLYKQILSDRQPISFLPEQISSEKELMQSVSEFLDELDAANVLSVVQQTMNQLKDGVTDLNKVYVQGSNLTKLSTLLYGKWDVLGEKLRSNMVTGNTKKAQKEKSKEIESWLENKCFSIAQIQSMEPELMEQASHPLSIMELLTDLTMWKYDSDNQVWMKKSLLQQCCEARVVEFSALKESFERGLSLNSDGAKEILKSVLDKYMELFHVLELLKLGGKASRIEKDDFYHSYDQLFESSEEQVLISHIIPLYTKVRNYLTRKLADKGKMLLKFDSPTRANGWDDCSIVVKDGHYYLMLYLQNLSSDEREVLNSGTSANLVIYDQQKSDFKNFPRIFINSKGGNQSPAVSKYDLPIEMVGALYNERKALTSESEKNAFDKCHPDYEKRLIEYYKIGLLRHEDFRPFWEKFEKMWKETSEYSSLQEFFSHTNEMCYKLSFKPIDFDYLFHLQETGKLLLFSISNKDYKAGAKGTPNLHTLYWEELFSEDNLKDVVFKLSSQGIEFFFRDDNKTEKIVHKRGSILVNKTFSDGTPIDAELYRKFCRHFNGQDVEFTDEERKLRDKASTHEAHFDLTKDKRYHEPKFFLHVPITINFKAPATMPKQFNNKTLEILRQHKEELNIIGIDRGERNLVYVSVINQRGENLIPPRHYNLIGNYDYLTKLKQTEKNRDAARKNWTTIERIKDLKTGYLSQVVHEITLLIVKYKAIVVLEDLNFGFKRGRFNVERQVYQNFEKMLIQKLNYLALKTDETSRDFATVRTGLQLTSPFTTFKELGKQCGWLFYVPAGYTSKIDPATGFVNLFNMNRPADSLRKFFGAFDMITYKDGLFYFKFNYSKEDFNTVKTDYQNDWTLASHGSRIVGHEKKMTDLTSEFKDFFESVHIPLCDVSVKSVSSLDESELQRLWDKFKLLLKMRNSNEDIDFIISPVASENYFITGENNSMQINDADANGAYNIALKGLYWLWNNFPEDGGYLKYIHDTEWFKFIQTKPYLND